jgi:hypothetical protein
MQTLHHFDEFPQTAQQENVRLCRSVRRTLEDQYENWKKSSFLEKSMMRKDFARYTDMSIEDMVSTLKKLEYSLLNQAPIMEFLEPLRKLAAYQRKAQNDSKQTAQLATKGHSRLTEAELLVNVIVNDTQRMLLDRITARDHEYGQTRTDIDDDTSSFPVLEYYEKSVKERRTDIDDDTSSFPVLEYYEVSRQTPAPSGLLVQSPTVSFSCMWGDEALPRVKYLQTV